MTFSLCLTISLSLHPSISLSLCLSISAVFNLGAEHGDVQAFDLDHAVDASQSVDHALQVLQIVDIDGQIDPSRPVVQNLVIGARVANIGFDISDSVSQRRKLSCAVFSHH